MTRQPGKLPWFRTLLGFSVLLAWMTSVGCAGYQGHMWNAHEEMRRGDVDRAIEFVELAVESDEVEEGGDGPLLLLERATLLQAAGRHKEAVRDFRDADKILEVLDLRDDSRAEIGKYLISDDITLYKAPPHEKVLLNTLAMISYLAMGDFESAQVEGRRLAVMQKYLKGATKEEYALFSVGSYLAGFANEYGGSKDEALRYYLEAYDYHRYQAAEEPLVVLAEETGFEHDLVATAKAARPDAKPLPDDEGEVLIIVQNGRAPYKSPNGFPIGTYMDSDSSMSAEERAEANQAISLGLIGVVSFPQMVRVGPAYNSIFVSVDGRQVPGRNYLFHDIEGSVFAAWDEIVGELRAAAVTRMVTRVLARHAAEATGRALDLDKALPGASILLGLAVQGAMAANDEPDTRVWTTLPASIEIFRVRMPVGDHKITVDAHGGRGGTKRRDVTVSHRKPAVVVLRYLR